jgi:hypothetical protein
MDALHVGLGVHHVLLLPADEENGLEVICEAALVAKIRRKEEGIVSLFVFPEGSEITTVGNVAHSLTLEDGTWHFISECQTDS